MYSESVAMVNNILSIYAKSNSSEMTYGFNWYKIANNEAKKLAKKYSHKLFNPFVSDIEIVCGIIAALSPACAWQQNLIDAESVLKNGKNAKVCTYGQNLKKAINILNSKTESPLHFLGGFKVKSFYHNLLLNDRFVTIDRHAIRIAKTEITDSNDKRIKNIFSAWNQYRLVAKSYRIAAGLLDIEPYQLQAITWVTYRRINGIDKVKNR